MTLTKTAALATIVATAFGAAVLAQPPAPAAPRPAPVPATGVITAIPANLKPTSVSGSGINCVDLEAQKKWYMTVLGMHVVRTLDRNGTPYEYILSTDPVRAPGAGILALIRGARQPGAGSYGRFILNVANADATAEFLRTHGVAARKVAAGAYFITDPEGNSVELYQAGAPS